MNSRGRKKIVNIWNLRQNKQQLYSKARTTAVLVGTKLKERSISNVIPASG